MADKRQTKATQARHERILTELLKLPGNDRCADCRDWHPRWTSYSLGIFICVRCASFHRKMGTHISKVKSITMDQWTPEQIDVIRNAGGNDLVNSKIIPHPEKHPLSLSEDHEHALEMFIRKKWEKKAFMEKQPKPQSLQSLDPHARLQSVPRRSSSVPVVSRDVDNHSKSLELLREMGFRNEIRNQQVLRQTQGNVQAAAEALTRSGSFPVLESGTGLSEDQKLTRLHEMGFTDMLTNREALRRSGGNFEVATSLLNDIKSAPTSVPTTTEPQLAGRAQTSSERQASRLQYNTPVNLMDFNDTSLNNTMVMPPQLSPSNPFAQFSGASAPPLFNGTSAPTQHRNPFTAMTSSASLPNTPLAQDHHPSLFQQQQLQLQQQQQQQQQTLQPLHHQQLSLQTLQQQQPQQSIPTFYSNSQMHSTYMPNTAPPSPLSPHYMNQMTPQQPVQPQQFFQSQPQPYLQNTQPLTSQFPWASGGL